MNWKNAKEEAAKGRSILLTIFWEKKISQMRNCRKEKKISAWACGSARKDPGQSR